MGRMAQLWNIFRKRHRPDPLAEGQPIYIGERNLSTVVFSKKYRTIVHYKYTERYPEILMWLNENTTGAVKIKTSQVSTSDMFIGFEKSDDALFFKIRFKL